MAMMNTRCYIVFVMAGTARGQLSMRPPQAILERLRQRARLSGEPHTTLAERYLCEGLLMDEIPGIHFVDGPMGRRPALLGTGLDVWEVVKVVKDNGSAAEAAAYLEIEPRLVELAIRYYGSNREEIDAWIARVHELSELEETRWHAAREAIGA
jgi:uncharacterized protein (DUF433 family)